MKIFRWLLTTMFLLALSGAFAVLWVNEQFRREYELAGMTEVSVPRGAGLNRTAALLEEKGVVADARLFVLYARLNGLAGKIKAGEYAFAGTVSIEKAARRLAEGDVIVRSVTIPEGKTLAEIKKILADNPYLSGDITLELQEGDVLPETYHFFRGESRNSILAKAKTAMKNELAAAFAGRDKDLPLTTEKELLTLASIVEKETGLASERGKVASVFVNRLNLGMKLQTDPTVIYAVTNGQMNLGRPLYKKDLTADSPYNTYVYAGLPPAPICSPGREAIRAAAHPEKTKYLYFVADGLSGGHRFARSLTEHNRNVTMYRRSKKTLKSNAENGRLK